QLIAQKDEVIAAFRERKYLGLFDEGRQVPIVKGQVRFLDAHTIEVDGPEGTTCPEGEPILVALGSSPAIPAIEGLRDVLYLTSDLLTSQEDLELTDMPDSLIVIGGGYIAVELGQMFSRFGTTVTILARSVRLLSAHEPEIGLALGDILRAEGLDVRTPVGAHDGGIAVHNALSGEAPRRIDHRVIPRAVFTDPQVGVVGMTDEEATAAGLTCWCNTIPLELVPRAGAIRDTRGVIKMVADAE